MTDREVDHAIIGGGIAGLYCCYHLKDKLKDAKIELFEASDRLGGRIETWRIDPKLLREHIQNGVSAQVRVHDLLEDGDATGRSEKPARPPVKPGDLMIAEFGPMRIEPDHQPYLKELLTRLGITPFDGSQEKWTDLIPFPPYQGPPPDEPQFILEDEEALQTTLVDLLLLALRRSFEVIRFADIGDEAGLENPWRIGPPWTTKNPNDEYEFVGPYDEANFFWREIRNKEYLHRKYWKRNLMQWIKLLDEPHYQYIFKQAQFRGTLLRDMGFWNLLGSVLSHMATVKLRDWASFYHLLPENPSAAAWIVFWLRGLKSTNALKGIRGGMDLIVHKLCDRLDFEAKEHEDVGCSHVVYGNKTGAAASLDGKAVKLRLNRKLVRIEDTGEDILLTFQKTIRTMEAGEISVEPTGEEERIRVKGHVILAVPKGPLQDIEFVGRNPQSPKLLRQMFDAVSFIPLLKCFFVVDNPFWEDNRPANRYAHTVPTRELHYWKSEDKQTGLLMIYTDPPGIQFWSDYLGKDLKKDISRQLGKDEGSVYVQNLKQSEAKIWCWSNKDHYPDWVSKKFDNDRLVRTFLLYAQHGGAESITADAILAAGMRDWGLEPYDAACHAWRPNTTPQQIMSYLSAFSLSGDASDRSAKKIHICGEAYSDFQGFIEGALRSAALVLTQEPFALDNAELTGAARKPAPILPRTVAIPEHEKQSSARTKKPM